MRFFVVLEAVVEEVYDCWDCDGFEAISGGLVG